MEAHVASRPFHKEEILNPRTVAKARSNHPGRNRLLEHKEKNLPDFRSNEEFFTNQEVKLMSDPRKDSSKP
jgi:hypothetical protein